MRADTPEGSGSTGPVLKSVESMRVPVVGAFVGDPFPFAAGAAAEAMRIAFNFFVLETHAVEALDMDVSTFGSVCHLRDRYRLEEWAVAVGWNSGAACSSLEPVRRLSTEEFVEIGSMALHRLSDFYGNGASINPRRVDPVPSTSEGPLDPNTVSQIAPRLRSLPRQLLDRFLQHFEVCRIRDIPAVRKPEVLQLLNALEVEARPQYNIDPFS